MVEHVTENHGVGGSIPSLGTTFQPHSFSVIRLEADQAGRESPVVCCSDKPVARIVAGRAVDVPPGRSLATSARLTNYRE